MHRLEKKEPGTFPAMIEGAFKLMGGGSLKPVYSLCAGSALLRLLLAFVCFASLGHVTPAQAQTTSPAAPVARLEQAAYWLKALAPPPGVTNELEKFGGLRPSYVRSFPGWVHERVVNELESAMKTTLTSGRCREKLDIRFMKGLGTGEKLTRREADFEGDMIRIEFIACLSTKLRAQRLGEVLLSDRYQRRALDIVTESNRSGARTCQKTSTPMVGRSSYCFESAELFDDGLFVTHSLIDSNTPGFSAPIFFREMVGAAVETRRATVFYSLTYMRGSDLNSFLRFFARGKLESSQKQALESLTEMAKGESP